MKTRCLLAVCAALFGCGEDPPGAVDSTDASFQFADADAPGDAPRVTTDGTSTEPDAPPVTPGCGDGTCAVGESFETCPEDCTPVCGDGFCTGDESSTTCPEECGTVCGDDLCNGDETGATCVADCGPSCGDAVCNGNETGVNCSEDCGTTCGDLTCQGAETTTTCPTDCGSECGDDTCNGPESSVSCPQDCGVSCGDGTCNGSETTVSCVIDCGPLCGDSACNGNETSGNCSEDCGPTCGDGTCGDGESSTSCPQDCGSECGDSVCNGAEDSMDCPADCGSSCGDTVCNGDETTANCPQDCGASCGDGICADSETETCPGDCGSVCGDGTCSGPETSLSCPADCAPICGDTACNGTEDSVSCPQDCAAVCGDGVCSGDEVPETCAEDCGEACGNGQCADGEDCLSCSADCACPCEQLCIDGGCVDDPCAPCGPPPEAETCDELDNDCDGSVDEDFVDACAGKECGDDGCGGSCGTCADNETCVDGACGCVSDCGSGELTELWDPTCTDPPCAEGFGAELIGLGFPPAVAHGTTTVAEFLLLNVGTETWTQGGVALGAVNDSDPLSPSIRVDLTGPVSTGQVGSFTVTLQAPALQAPRRVLNLFSDWRLVTDTNQWFGPAVNRWVSVYDTTPVETDSLTGKVLAGYQGWFATPDGPAPAGWRHWCKAGEVPSPTTVTFDLWPDLREWADSELTPTGFVYPDGTTAGLYSSYHFHTVERHVRWMKEYGLDGVWLQRFASELGDPVFKDFRDTVTGHMAQATQTHGRVFAIMYDISGMSETPSIFDQIVSDWKHLVDDLGVTDSPRYMHHGGRPVLGLWGPGFDNRPGDPVSDQALIEHLQNGIEPAYRVTVMGGVPQGWRTSSGSSKPGYSAVYDTYDLLSPWSVGAYSSDGYGGFKQNTIVPDLVQQGASAYVPVLWPGFSWTNLQTNQNGGGGGLNQHPRHGGVFMWDQAWGAYSAGATMGYIAMFDEVDESTAIFKAAETAAQTPTTGTFLSLDADGYALPSDWYLRLAGEVVNLFRGVYPNQPTHPLVTTGGGVVCGDGTCAPNVEDCGNCPGDCPCPIGASCQVHVCVDGGPACGDGTCTPGVEGCGSCPADCPCPTGTVCQNQECVDDGIDCGDGSCAPGAEDCGNCPGDCPCPGGTSCQNNQCVDDGSDVPGCGDASCAPGVEDCGSCPGDCPCPPGTACVNHQCVVDGSTCGDGVCQGGLEDCLICEADCACQGGQLCVGGDCIEF